MTSDKQDIGASTSQRTPRSNNEDLQVGLEEDTAAPVAAVTGPPGRCEDPAPASTAAPSSADKDDLQHCAVEESVGSSHGEASALEHSKDLVPKEDVPGVAAVAASGLKEADKADASSVDHSEEEPTALPVTTIPGATAVATTTKATGTASSDVSTSSKNNPPGLSIKEMQCVDSWVIEFLKDHPHVIQFDSLDWPRCWDGMGKKVQQVCGTNRSDAECRVDFEELREKRAVRSSNRWTEGEEVSMVNLRGILGNRWLMIRRLIGRYNADEHSLRRKYNRIMTSLEKHPRVKAELSPALRAAKRQKTVPTSHPQMPQESTTPTRKLTSKTVLQSPSGEIDVDRFVKKTMEKRELVSRNFEAHAAVVGGRMSDLEYVWEHKGDEKNKSCGDTFLKVDSRGRNCLDLAAVWGRTEMVNWLLEKGLQFNTAFSYPFMMSLAHGDSWEQHCTTDSAT